MERGASVRPPVAIHITFSYDSVYIEDVDVTYHDDNILIRSACQLNKDKYMYSEMPSSSVFYGIS